MHVHLWMCWMREYPNLLPSCCSCGTARRSTLFPRSWQRVCRRSQPPQQQRDTQLSSVDVCSRRTKAPVAQRTASLHPLRLLHRPPIRRAPKRRALHMLRALPARTPTAARQPNRVRPLGLDSCLLVVRVALLLFTFMRSNAGFSSAARILFCCMDSLLVKNRLLSSQAFQFTYNLSLYIMVCFQQRLQYNCAMQTV